MSKPYSKPLPVISDENRPFWQGAREGALRLQRCETCDRFRYPIAIVCPDCLDDASRWETVSGRGAVLSTIVFHQIYNKAFAEDAPYNVSLIQLDEGPRMFSNVIGAAPQDVKVGARVEAVFTPATDEITIPQFRLASAKT